VAAAVHADATRPAAGPSAVPPIVYDVLRSPGRALDQRTRAFFEPRFGRDFSHVRVHADSRAAESARAVNASAYTVGRDLVLGPDAPRSAPARLGLMAHELAHVVQHDHAWAPHGAPLSIGRADDGLEHEASQVGASVMRGTTAPRPVRRRAPAALLSRADPAAVARVMGRGAVVGSGVQLWPTNVVDTRVGPVSGQGGLLGDQTARLSVIVGENLTLRGLARQLLPLWTTATPFTDPTTGVPVPLVAITENELARGLAVFNQFYLPLPAMTAWRAGLRFPLPVEIDEGTGVATVHPLLIQSLAGGFSAAWEPLLDQPAAATVAPAPADLRQQATDFMTAHPSVLGRGIGLGAQALTNATAARPLIAEVFRQLGAGAFDVALAFMDELVNRQVDLLASQRDGAAILADVAAALAARPAVVSPDQQTRLDRANLMLGRRAAIAPRQPPGRACEPGHVRNVTVQPVFFRDNAADPAPTGASFPGRMQVTRDVWAKVGVQFAVNAAIMRNDPTHKHRGTTDPEARAIAALRTAAGVEVFVVDNDLLASGGAVTFVPASVPASQMVMSDRGTSSTLLAHEMGHVLGLEHPGDGTAHDGEAGTIMRPSGSHSAENPTRNTAVNAARLIWPAGAATCIRPDP
jgi:Domain of unknown function (DUF4157)